MIQLVADGRRGVFKAHQSGRVVAWAVSLSQPNQEQTDFFGDFYASETLGTRPTGRIAVVKRKGDGRSYKLKGQSAVVDLTSSLGSYQVFTLYRPDPDPQGRVPGADDPDLVAVVRDRAQPDEQHLAGEPHRRQRPLRLGGDDQGRQAAAEGRLDAHLRVRLLDRPRPLLGLLRAEDNCVAATPRPDACTARPGWGSRRFPRRQGRDGQRHGRRHRRLRPSTSRSAGSASATAPATAVGDGGGAADVRTVSAFDFVGPPLLRPVGHLAQLAADRRRRRWRRGHRWRGQVRRRRRSGGTGRGPRRSGRHRQRRRRRRRRLPARRPRGPRHPRRRRPRRRAVRHRRRRRRRRPLRRRRRRADFQSRARFLRRRRRLEPRPGRRLRPRDHHRPGVGRDHAVHDHRYGRQTTSSRAQPATT